MPINLSVEYPLLEAKAQRLETANKNLVDALQDCINGFKGILPDYVAIDNPYQMDAYHAYHNAKAALEANQL